MSLENMRVLLLNPPAKGGQSRDGRCQTEGNSWIVAFPPTTFASIAGCIRSKFGPDYMKVVDCIGDDIGYHDALSLCTEFKPDFLVLNTSTPTIESDLGIAGDVRRETDCKIIAYGENITARYRELLEDGGVDFAILGEPETPVVRVLEGKPESQGVAFGGWDGGIWNEPDLDSLAFPAYDLLPTYRYPFTDEAWMFVRTGRGCPFNCIFCVEPLTSPHVRLHSVDYLIRQFKWLCDELGIKVFMFWEEVATLNRQHMLSLCDRMVEEGLSQKIKWFCTTRVDHFDDELAEAMKEAGCRMVAFGFESGSQRVLDLNRKGITLEQSRKAVDAAKKNGLLIIGHFIIGLLGDNVESARKTSAFARELGINFAQFYIATPFPGSLFYKKVVEEGWLVEDDMSKIEQGSAVVSYPDFSAEQMRRERRNAYLRFYLRPYSIYSNIVARSWSVLVKIPFQMLKFSRWALK